MEVDSDAIHSMLDSLSHEINFWADVVIDAEWEGNVAERETGLAMMAKYEAQYQDVSDCFGYY